MATIRKFPHTASKQKVGHVTTTQLILPQLPDNLENLHKEEERIRTNALLAINADTALKDHMNMIHASMDVIWIFTREHKNRTDDELTIQLLGIRLFNASASALALMLDGYYQTSLTLLPLCQYGYYPACCSCRARHEHESGW